MSRSRWRLPPSLVRAALAGHSALGLAVGAFLFTVVLSGTVALFVPECDGWQQQRLPRLERLEPTIVTDVFAAVPADPAGWRRLAIEYPTASLPRPILTATPVRGEARRFAVGERGTLTPIAEPWSRFLVDLHERLTLPGTIGLVIVGLLGIAMLALVVMGVLAHPRLFRDAFLWRPRAGEKQAQADVHNRLSVWAFPFHATIALTGAALALSTLIAAVVTQYAYHAPLATVGTALLGPTAAKDGPAAPLPDLAPVLTVIDGRATPIQRVIVDAPRTAGQLVRVDIRTPSRLAYGDRLFFDARGVALNPGGMLDRTPGLSLLSSFFALHFGSFGGIALRCAYGLLGLSLCTVVASGIRIWLARRRSEGRSLPITERLWVGWVWGTAFALSASYAGALAGIGATIGFASGLVVALIASALTPSARAARRLLSMATLLAVAAALVAGG